ncbi:MAG TPA: HD-GYP domain-containing protein [Clostridiales bacterium]|nr:HD-GYP domain-containing protein [Clostridiales bacterium]
MRFLSVDQLEEEMIIGEDIVGNHGIMFLWKGTILTERYIQGLKRLGVDYVYVMDSQTDHGSESDEKNKVVITSMKLNKAYHKALDTFKSVYQNVGMSNEVEIQKVQEVVSPMLEEIISNQNILGRLRQIDIEDDYTYKHSVEVCMLSVMIGKWLNLSSEQLSQLAISALLHDIGKSKIPLEILNKPGKLTAEEFELVKKHTIFGYEMIKNAGDIPESIAYGILQHHERRDGSGYPYGLKGEEIHLFGRIIAVADIFDAMTSERVYKRKESPFKTAEILEDSRFKKLDPHICSVFLDNISKFYVGNIVRLNTGEIGEVVLVHKNVPTRPLVRVGEKFIDLSKQYEYEIEEIIV